jgi:hypothetical protein
MEHITVFLQNIIHSFQRNLMLLINVLLIQHLYLYIN